MRKLWNSIKAFYDNTYGMLILLSWILFIICLIIKLFGGNWFELGTDNERFIAFCEYVDTNRVLKMILACLIYLITGYPVICILLNKKRLDVKSTLVFVPIMISKSIISWYSVLISYILDVFVLIILPLIFTKFKGWKRVIFGNILLFGFQVISIVVRNISPDFNVGNTLIENYLYQSDYYLMIILFYFYYFKSKNKSNKENN